MREANTKSVKMTFKALYSYVLNTNYRSYAGVIGLVISFGAIGLLIANWSGFGTGQRAMLIIIGLVFTVINPLSLGFKTYQQLKLSPSHKIPLDYTFSSDGITVSQGEVTQLIQWDMICRIMLTKHMVAVYTSRIHAFVIPLTELGEDKGRILTAMVSFTANNEPRLSRNLKIYTSGKGL